MINKGNTFSGMQRICSYFESFIGKDNLFYPEYVAALAINSLVEALEVLKESDVQKILDIIKETENKEHYNGSGWFDYKLHVFHFLKNNNFDVDQHLKF